MGSYSIRPVRSPEQFATLGALFQAYQAHIGVDLCFQGFAAELANLAHIYGAPRATAFIAYAGAQTHGEPIGCAALKPLTPDVCEMKRLYVRPRHQRAGIGRALALAIIERARELGYQRMRLDTLASMLAAQALYRRLGFVEIAAYNDNPHPATRFMELSL
jgi:putative acetyltransferase